MKSSPGQKDHTQKSTKILACTCKHEFQDQRYGPGMRVHNPRKEKTYACTVCGREKDA
jgi:predicted SprT family Zn-dependent metalloprotease